ncbi:hypothetical protein [Burkholderia cenocepacia]|uniref:hypothetical protein n=1 Tax=Burkholderia cenocepacia TaxID=95486 RepID=UPI000760EB28|nr:hypothetical protein [Burkholderia cenocepacia]KWU26377.1 hypothetical protein AS149_25650 [Burkholderia cenocepacia]
MKENSQRIKDRATIAQKHLKGLGIPLKRNQALGLVARLDGYRNYVSATKGNQHESTQKLASTPVRTFRGGFERKDVVADYVHAGGQHCPACGSNNVYDKLESNSASGKWELLTGCSTCGHDWWAAYDLAARDGLGLSTVRSQHLASPDACPFCVVSFDLEYGDVRAGSRLYQPVKCTGCLRTWVDIYDLTDAIRTEDTSLLIIENGQQLVITELQEHALLAAGVIYDSEEGYYHIENGRNWSNVDAILSRLIERKTAAQQASEQCWSCLRPVTARQRADNDGFCPHCMAELSEDE